MMKRVALAVGIVLMSWAGLSTQPALAQAPSTHQHSFGGAEHWAQYFDDPKRDEWQKPHEVIHALALPPNAKVADLGSGTGYFSVRLAHFVPEGRVYGVDIEPDMVKYLADRAKREGLKNVTSVAGRPDDPRLPEKVDLILMVDVYHHIANRERFLRKLQNYLKPNGRVAIIDFNQKSPMGPPPADRIPAAQVKSDLEKAGCAVDKEETFLPDQHFLVFKVAKR